METQDDQVPETIGTLIHHDDSHGYTFIGTTVSEVGGSSRQGLALADASVQVGAQGRRVEVQTDASVHGNTRVQGSSTRIAAVSARMSRNLRLPIAIRIEVKGELGDKFPARVGFKHDIPSARNVLCSYENMLHSTTSDRDKKWFKHLVMAQIVLCGDDFKAEFCPDGELTRLGWTTFERMLISKDAWMYGRTENEAGASV